MSKPYVDPYAVLELPRTASTAEIKKAYFTLVRAHPPEREPDTFKRIRAAYERLREPERRAETDMLLLRSWEPPARKRRMKKLSLELHIDDVLAAAECLTDLGRSDWREHQEKVAL
jgi:curved DNA-binding protein CbpA